MMTAEIRQIGSMPTLFVNGERQVPISRHLYIEADDFLETPFPSISACIPTAPSAA